jgi:phospholipid/cholesterol/gamma-HCH transport system substrate-binding protein
METRANYVAVGAFVLILIAGAAGVLLWLIGGQFNTQVAYYEISFEGSVAGLGKDSPVRYNGIQVGKVTEVDIDELNPNHVRVIVALDPSTIIRSDAVATLVTQLMSGSAYIEISGGTMGAPPFPHRTQPPYPFIRSESSGLQSIFNKAPELLKQLLVIENQIEDILNDKNRAAIADTLGNVRKLTGDLAAHTNDINTILVNTADASRQLDEAAKSVNRLAKKTEITMGHVDTAVGHADKLFLTANRLVTHTDETVQENRPGLRNLTTRGVNQLEQLLGNANDLMVKLGRVADELERNPSRFLFGGQQRGYQPK